MTPKRFIPPLREWYAALLCLYPKPYRERFSEPMAQTFHDLLHERAEEEKGLFGFALALFAETFAGIVRENMVLMMHDKKQFGLRPALFAAAVLLIPLIAMQFTNEVNWSLFDFIIMGILLFGAGLAYELAARRAANNAYRVAAGVAVAAALLLTWVNLAVGIIGDNNPVNLLYFGVIAVGAIGALVARLQPAGMVRALLATAVAQMLVPVIALVVDRSAVLTEPPGVVGVFALNGFFAAAFILSALLFRRANAFVIGHYET
jgi:hypothetical protein